MKKAFMIILVIAQLFIICACAPMATTTTTTTTTSDYANYYSQFVDSKESLTTLAQKDMATWGGKTLSELLDSNMEEVKDIAYGSDPIQKLDVYRLKDGRKRPVIFYIHGGGWAVEDKSNVIPGKAWLSMGYTVVSINYHLGLIEKDDPTAAKRMPLQPVSEKVDSDQRNAHPAQIDDCAMALDWVTKNIDKYGGDPDKIAITGFDAGGHLSALLAVNTDVQKKFGIDMTKIKCAIPVGGVYDCTLPENYSHPWMAAFMKALLDDPRKAADASPVNHVTGNEPPILIVHGTDDWLVPRTNAYAFYKKLKEKGAKNVELEMLKGYWHGSVLTRYNEPEDDAAKVINRFLATYIPADGNHADSNTLDIALRLNDSTVDMSKGSVFINTSGNIMVPLTFVTKNIGAWIQPDSKGVYKFVLGNATIEVPESMTDKKDKTIFVPLMFVAQGLGAKVQWIPDTKTALVNFN